MEFEIVPEYTGTADALRQLNLKEKIKEIFDLPQLLICLVNVFLTGDMHIPDGLSGDQWRSDH